MANSERVFVYGTLMPGRASFPVAVRAGLHAAHPAIVRGYRLYHLEPEGYPAVVPGPGEVHGVVLSLAGSLAELDALEAIDAMPPLYRRVRCVPDGRPEVWIYVYARPARLAEDGAHWLPEGRWPRPSTYES